MNHSSHFGAAGYYATLAPRRDMVGLSMNVDAWMMVPGARGRRSLGNNPLAYAVPAGQEQPVFLDIALSMVAVTKVFNAQADGKSIPERWMVDEVVCPRPTTAQYPEKGV